MQGKPRMRTISTPPSSTSSYSSVYTCSCAPGPRGCHQNPVNLEATCEKCLVSRLVTTLPVKFFLHYVAGQSGGERVISDPGRDCIVAVGEALLAAAGEVRHPDVARVDEGDQVGIVRAHRGVQPSTRRLGLHTAHHRSGAGQGCKIASFT